MKRIQRLSAGNSVEDNVELQAYLSELNRSFENLEVRFKTGNVVDNAMEACQKMTDSALWQHPKVKTGLWDYQNNIVSNR